jgi:glycerol-3-phosphate acyltransferase PlsX
MKIGIDIMGGDYAPKATIGGTILSHKELSSDIQLCLFGDEKIITSSLLEAGANLKDFEIFHAPEVIGMGEHPTKALSLKPNSSIALGFEMLKNNKIDAFAGAGNTGAMLVGSMYSVGVIHDIIRPCTSAILPRENGGVGIILDIGTNSDCRPDVLYQFGILGSLYAKYVFNIKVPKVGLLNIGEEEEKGNILTQAAFKLMKETKDFNFIGNIEGYDLFKDKADVIICDGFIGNIVLKQAESMYGLFLKKGFSGDFLDKFNYENYGGTPILGINSSVIIGHGISNENAIKNMILLAKDIHEAKLCEKIKIAMNSYTHIKENECPN